MLRQLLDWWTARRRKIAPLNICRNGHTIPDGGTWCNRCS
jgi:hypothetical protein